MTCNETTFKKCVTCVSYDECTHKDTMPDRPNPISTVFFLFGIGAVIVLGLFVIKQLLEGLR